MGAQHNADIATATEDLAMPKITGPMNTYPVNPDTLDEMLRTLQFVLDEPQLFTASGRTPKNPATSMARLPELEMTSRTGGGRAFAPQ